MRRASSSAHFGGMSASRSPCQYTMGVVIAASVKPHGRTQARYSSAMPKSDPPTNLVAQPLIKGNGPVVTAGQKINVQYTGALWRDGKVFDSSWKRGESITFPIGTGGVIAGWDEGLVGQTVGSQVLLVVPPDKGYGADGQPAAGIKGTDTMVFVVDILGAA